MRKVAPVLIAMACWLPGAAVCAQLPLGVNPPSRVSYARGANGQDNRGPAIRTFLGTITKNGDQFVLNESKTHKLYELDDQVAASKFANQAVTITGTLDTVKNIIRIQSITQATA